MSSCRIIAFNGPWQFIVARAAIRAHHGATEEGSWKLVLTGAAANTRLHQLLLRLAAHYFPQAEVFDLTGLPPARMMETMAGALAGRRLPVEEVWCGSPKTHLASTLYLLFPRASFHMFEEGLHSYTASFSLSSGPAMPQKLGRWLGPGLGRGRHAGPNRLCPPLYDKAVQMLQNRALPPAAAFHGILSDQLPVQADSGVPRHVIPEAGVREEIALYCSFVGSELPRYEEPCILFLGENLLWTLRHDYERLLDATVAAFQAATEAGYRVLWKPHPRMPRFCSEYLVLKSASPRVTWLPEMDLLPAEVAFGQSGLRAVASLMSSCLFYFPRFFGIPSYHLPYPESLPALGGGLDEVLQLCQRHSEPLAQWQPTESE
ncbi:MAG: polysialyltransferase family glycosyltransferase [Verrucomicrobiota bacterium JB022]|nr:polysialyltransferase family glycosyltransferase [Verrucomicrobiota bacterium JB022]